MVAGKPAAFEELCCQLARRAEQPRQFVRLRGDGGDGGIEGYVESPEGKRGWQAKYVFESSALVAKASKSFRTALENYPDLRSFTLCFPFDPTGKTGRGKGDVQKLDDWKASELRYAKERGLDIEIKFWSASDLRDLIMEHDISGGLRDYFFGGRILTNQWFKDHLAQARATAGPRYTPELNVSTDLAQWFAAFCRTDAWSNALKGRLHPIEKELRHLGLSNTKTSSQTRKSKGGLLDSVWPGDSRARVAAQAAAIEEVIAKLQQAENLDDKQEYLELKEALQSSARKLRVVEQELVLDIDSRHGDGAADSPGFRQHMAEWEVSFPAANLDSTRRIVAALDEVVEWLDSPAFALAFEASFVMTGEAGSGKTHGVCDIAHQRHDEDLRTCLLFGHQFVDESDPWTSIAETLDLTGLGRERLLDVMDSAGEASGSPLLLCIDAINETKPLGYWQNHLMPLLQAAKSRRFLRVCVVCRTPYTPMCLPEQNSLPQFEHHGFSGHQREACRSYCKYYELLPPAMPTLQPEFRNPLYLRLVCETACSLELPRLPADWAGSVPAIRAFLQEKERCFAIHQQVPPHAKFMQTALIALVSHLANHAATDVSWSGALDAVLACMAATSQEQAARYLHWLLGEGLLIENASSRPDSEATLRPAFERLGDFLIADAVLPEDANAPVELTRWIGTVEDIKRHDGMLGVLSALLPERRGLELPDMADDCERSRALLDLTVKALPSRSRLAFTDRSEAMIYRALNLADLSFHTMDALVSIAWRQSRLDAHWLDGLLRLKSLAERDSYWCMFLHESFSEKRSVAELIEAAQEAPLEGLDPSTAERWAKLLLWFTAAADRRVKDGATRAAVAVLTVHPNVLPVLMETMLSIDDDAVRERLLLVAYGVLLKTRELDALKSVSTMLWHHYTADPSAFSNALIRDHIRAICELAWQLDVLAAGVDPKFASEQIGREAWPLTLPSDEEVEAWIPSIWPYKFDSDFFRYSMSCLSAWEDGMTRKDMASWILQTVARDFQFFESGCEGYDRRMRQGHGFGRSKPAWAETIGKKYAWIAMYQLASRLHDNVARKRDSWAPEPIRPALILGGERQLDPAIRQRSERAERHRFFTTPRLDTNGIEDDRAWVAFEEDIPKLSELVKAQSVRGQGWCPLVAYLSSDRPDHHQDDSPYRQIWLQLFGYLVDPRVAAPLFERLWGRNFLGQWMPEGLRLGGEGGFVSEYPWATSYNLFPDEWYFSGTDDRMSELVLPAWNELSCEWEYDTSLASKTDSINVPARLFFSSSNELWSDGRGGYRRGDGRTVFLDPSVGLKGPSILMADVEHLKAKLGEVNRSLIWTLLGQKWMLGDFISESERTPIRTFSQVAWMKPDGAIQESDLVFFDDRSEKTGLA